MLRRTLAGLVFLAAAAITSCSGVGTSVVEAGSGDLPTARAPETPARPSSHATRAITAESTAAAIGYAVSTVTGLVTLTVRNDPQHLLGRPDGYVAAIVVFDERVTCETVGVSCGAEIEQWPNPVAAQRRSAFQPLLAHEYHYRYGAVLIRVTGALAPADALEYDRALWEG